MTESLKQIRASQAILGVSGIRWSQQTWVDRRDINYVMLTTSLAPDGFLALAPPG
jgi:hypothetical protein